MKHLLYVLLAASFLTDASLYGASNKNKNKKIKKKVKNAKKEKKGPRKNPPSAVAAPIQTPPIKTPQEIYKLNNTENKNNIKDNNLKVTNNNKQTEEIINNKTKVKSDNLLDITTNINYAGQLKEVDFTNYADQLKEVDFSPKKNFLRKKSELKNQNISLPTKNNDTKKMQSNTEFKNFIQEQKLKQLAPLPSEAIAKTQKNLKDNTLKEIDAITKNINEKQAEKALKEIKILIKQSQPIPGKASKQFHPDYTAKNAIPINIDLKRELFKIITNYNAELKTLDQKSDSLKEIGKDNLLQSNQKKKQKRKK